LGRQLPVAAGALARKAVPAVMAALEWPPFRGGRAGRLAVLAARLCSRTGRSRCAVAMDERNGTR